MEYQDRELVCFGCKQRFHLMAREQTFYAEQGYAPPKRCARVAELSAAASKRSKVVQRLLE